MTRLVRFQITDPSTASHALKKQCHTEPWWVSSADRAILGYIRLQIGSISYAIASMELPTLQHNMKSEVLLVRSALVYTVTRIIHVNQVVFWFGNMSKPRLLFKSCLGSPRQPPIPTSHIQNACYYLSRF